MESNDEDERVDSRHGERSEICVTLSLPPPSPLPLLASASTSLKRDREYHSVVENDENEIDNQFRRSSSLRIQKNYGTSTTPAQKKMVRFADVLGLDLASVRTFLDELPAISPAATTIAASRFVYDECAAEATGATRSSLTNTLVPTFESPAELADFADRVRSRRVCLETARVGEAPVPHIAGRIKVANLDFCKRVYVRYTLDEWKTYAEVRATYVPPETDEDVDDRFCDRFSFVIYVYDTLSAGHRIEFAIRYHCRGAVYWDNNDGKNYAFQRSVDDGASAFLIPSTISSSSSPTCIDNFHHPFY